jgi:predicted glycosyltransferase
MRILVEITHPADVHFFRNAMGLWSQRGHEIAITARRKEVITDLLDFYGLQYDCLSERGGGRLGLLTELVKRDARLLTAARRFRADILLGFGGTCAAHVGWLTRRPSIVFYDTDNAALQNRITYPFATRICTPECYIGDLGPKHVKFKGYKELAYLHPQRFIADRSVLRQVGIGDQERFSLVRFVSWQATHDWGKHGLATDHTRKLVSLLKQHGRLLISSEAPLPEDLAPYAVTVHPALIHHVMAFADLFVGESATMAVECAVLGVPAVYLTDPGLGYTKELSERYELLCSYSNQQTQQALEKVEELLHTPDLAALWLQRRDRMLAEHVDVTQWMVDFVEKFAD